MKTVSAPHNNYFLRKMALGKEFESLYSYDDLSA